MKFKNQMSSRLRQTGVTLLELVVSLSVLMIVSVGMVQLADRYSEDVKTSVVADQLKRTGDAARSYIKDNYTTIAATATSTSPFQITAAMLTAGGYLPTSSVSTNGYGQSVCTLVLQPSANKLQAMVIAEGGTTIDDLTLGNIVQLAGSSSGAVLSSATTAISGAMGGWSIPVSTWHNRVNNLSRRCDGTAGNVQVTTGHPALALWFEDGAYQSNALYRDAVAGRPELNTVNTPIIFNATQTVGSACTTAGAVANDAAGVVINCTGGTWKQISSAYWADPVATYAALPTCNAASSWATRIVRTPSASGGTGPRAYTCDGTTWRALGVDDTGNLVVGNTAVGAAMSTTATGTLAVGTVEVKKQVTAGTACSPNGAVATDSTGLILSCQSGGWKGSSADGLGYSQSWVNVSGSRCNNCTYTNNTSKPIVFSAWSQCGGYSGAYAYVNGNNVVFGQAQWNGCGAYGFTGNVIVPPGQTYAAYFPNGLGAFWELR